MKYDEHYAFLSWKAVQMATPVDSLFYAVHFTGKQLAESLSVENLPDEKIPSHLREAATAFRLLSEAERVEAAETILRRAAGGKTYF